MTGSVQPSAIDDSFEYLPDTPDAWITGPGPAAHVVDYQHFVEPGDERSAVDDRCLTEYGSYTVPFIQANIRNPARARVAIDQKTLPTQPRTREDREQPRSQASSKRRRPSSTFVIRGKNGEMCVKSNPFVQSKPVKKSAAPSSDVHKSSHDEPDKQATATRSGAYKVRIRGRNGEEMIREFRRPLHFTSPSPVTAVNDGFSDDTTVVPSESISVRGRDTVRAPDNTKQSVRVMHVSVNPPHQDQRNSQSRSDKAEDYEKSRPEDLQNKREEPKSTTQHQRPHREKQSTPPAPPSDTSNRFEMSGALPPSCPASVAPPSSSRCRPPEKPSAHEPANIIDERPESSHKLRPNSSEHASAIGPSEKPQNSSHRPATLRTTSSHVPSNVPSQVAWNDVASQKAIVIPDNSVNGSESRSGSSRHLSGSGHSSQKTTSTKTQATSWHSTSSRVSNSKVPERKPVAETRDSWTWDKPEQASAKASHSSAKAITTALEDKKDTPTGANVASLHSHHRTSSRVESGKRSTVEIQEGWNMSARDSKKSAHSAGNKRMSAGPEATSLHASDREASDGIWDKKTTTDGPRGWIRSATASEESKDPGPAQWRNSLENSRHTGRETGSWHVSHHTSSQKAVEEVSSRKSGPDHPASWSRSAGRSEKSKTSSGQEIHASSKARAVSQAQTEEDLSKKHAWNDPGNWDGSARESARSKGSSGKRTSSAWRSPSTCESLSSENKLQGQDTGSTDRASQADWDAVEEEIHLDVLPWGRANSKSRSSSAGFGASRVVTLSSRSATRAPGSGRSDTWAKESRKDEGSSWQSRAVRDTTHIQDTHQTWADASSEHPVSDWNLAESNKGERIDQTWPETHRSSQHSRSGAESRHTSRKSSQESAVRSHEDSTRAPSESRITASERWEERPHADLQEYGADVQIRPEARPPGYYSWRAPTIDSLYSSASEVSEQKKSAHSTKAWPRSSRRSELSELVLGNEAASRASPSAAIPWQGDGPHVSRNSLLAAQSRQSSIDASSKEGGVRLSWRASSQRLGPTWSDAPRADAKREFESVSRKTSSRESHRSEDAEAGWAKGSVYGSHRTSSRSPHASGSRGVNWDEVSSHGSYRTSQITPNRHEEVEADWGREASHKSYKTSSKTSHDSKTAVVDWAAGPSPSHHSHAPNTASQTSPEAWTTPGAEKSSTSSSSTPTQKPLSNHSGKNTVSWPHNASPHHHHHHLRTIHEEKEPSSNSRSSQNSETNISRKGNSGRFARPGAISPHPLSSVPSSDAGTVREPPVTEPAWERYRRPYVESVGSSFMENGLQMRRQNLGRMVEGERRGGRDDDGDDGLRRRARAGRERRAWERKASVVR